MSDILPAARNLPADYTNASHETLLPADYKSAEDTFLANVSHERHLPADYNTLYLLNRLRPAKGSHANLLPADYTNASHATLLPRGDPEALRKCLEATERRSLEQIHRFEFGSFTSVRNTPTRRKKLLQL